MKHSCRAARLIYLMRLLSSRPYRAAELAALCSVCHRTINYDLMELQMEPLRVPLVNEAGQWWVLSAQEERLRAPLLHCDH